MILILDFRVLPLSFPSLLESILNEDGSFVANYITLWNKIKAHSCVGLTRFFSEASVFPDDTVVMETNRKLIK